MIHVPRKILVTLSVSVKDLQYNVPLLLNVKKELIVLTGIVLLQTNPLELHVTMETFVLKTSVMVKAFALTAIRLLFANPLVNVMVQENACQILVFAPLLS
jgi:hypothetical protein